MSKKCSPLTQQHMVSCYLLCREVLGFKLNEMTTRKFYGTYFHDLTVHAPLQLRLVSGKTANTEEDERMFNTVTSITSSTSNGHPDHIIGNLFILLQAEEQLGKSRTTVAKQESQVSKLAKSLGLRTNTIIPTPVIKNHARSWQAHLQRIADFLLPGKGIWWCQKEGRIEFFDSQCALKDRSEGPILHHYRSSNHKNEESYLHTCWNECLEKNLCIPSHVIWTENKHGRVTKKDTGFLNDKGPGSHEDEVDIPVSIETAQLLNPDHLQEEEDEDVIMFNLVPDDESILHPRGDDNQSYCYNDQEVEAADVRTTLEPNILDHRSQPTSEVQKDSLVTGKHLI